MQSRLLKFWAAVSGEVTGLFLAGAAVGYGLIRGLGWPDWVLGVTVMLGLGGALVRVVKLSQAFERDQEAEAKTDADRANSKQE
jgi:hypothetical protein